MTLRDAIKAAVHGVATVLVCPMLASYQVRASFLGRDRALQGSAQLLALLPGLPGQYLRRAFLARTLDRCALSAVVEFGALFSTTRARIDENVYVGPGC